MSPSPSPPPARRASPSSVEQRPHATRRMPPSSDSSASTPALEDPSSSSNSSLPRSQASSSPRQPRRFLPQPVEESSRSSRQTHVDPSHQSTPPRTLSPGAHVTLTPADADPPSQSGAPTSTPSMTRRFEPVPVETTTQSSRRKFAPEPVETTVRKSRRTPAAQEDTASPPRRQFAPEPVETSTRSSKDRAPKESASADTATARPRRRFAPEPVETTVTRRRRQVPADPPADHDTTDPAAEPSASSSESSGHRKFSPELLETARGSYRRVHLPSPQSTTLSPTRSPPPAPADDAEPAHAPPTPPEESRFSAAVLARKHPEATRPRSFLVPGLPNIDSTSEEDEGSEAPSLINSASSMESESRHDSNHIAHESYTEYVLRLAAETVTEKELQEQAMAAYINERPHEPVDHFAISHDDDDDGPLPVPMFQGEKGADVRTFRRSSAAELDLEMANMRRHHEQLERAKQDLKADTAGQSRFSAAALATRHALEAKGIKKVKKPRAAADEDAELARMRAAASPPMLGADLVFPFTISPKMTRCDPDQPPRPRTDDSDDEPVESGAPNLWMSNEPPQSGGGGGGLWMGVCQAGLWQPPKSRDGLRSGIQTPAPPTPAAERTNPLESTTPGRGAHTPARRRQFAGMAFIPLTPPRSQDGDDLFTRTVDRKLQLEKQIEAEFPPRVITQLYNYLSLGYPSLAHVFDEELSKISRIPVDELRRDDDHADAKGYVGAPEGDGCDESDVIGGKCKRWEALRLYVREWARQSPNFYEDPRRARGPTQACGYTARRGSWGH